MGISLYARFSTGLNSSGGRYSEHIVARVQTLNNDVLPYSVGALRLGYASKYKVAVLIISAALLVTSLATISSAQSVEFSAPIVFNYHTDIEVQHIYALTSDRVVLIGTINGSSVVELLEFSDPLKGPTIIQRFSLVGKVTAASVDGYPPTRIAVGTDKGEITVFTVSQGRLFKYLNYLEGADFHVVKLWLMRAGTSVKVAALVSESGSPAEPCVDCFVYIFSDDSTSVLKIGAAPGNTTSTYPGIYPQDIGSLVISTSTGTYHAPVMILGWVPRLDMYTIVLNISYVQKNTVKPASGALVHVVAYKGEGSNLTVYRYGTNAGDNGIASITVPLGFIANITIYDISGLAHRIHFDPSAYGSNIKKYELSITLPAPPQTGDALEIYGTPEFMKQNIEVLDISNAPITYSSLRVLPMRLPPTSKGIWLLSTQSHPDKYVLVYVDTDSKNLTIAIMSHTYEIKKKFVDYVGAVSEVKAAYLTPSGDKLLVGLEDGRIKEYSISLDNETIRLENEYIMSGNLKKLALKVGAPSSFIAVSDGGVQVVRLGTFDLPILRGGITPDFYPEGYSDGDVYPDLSLLVLGGGQTVYVVRGLDKASTTVYDLSQVMAPSVRIEVSVPKGESPSNITVTLSYPWGSITKLTNDKGVVEFTNLIPGYTYTVAVTPWQQYIKSTVFSFELAGYPSTISYKVTLQYKIYSVKLSVSDSLTNGMTLTPYNILVDGQLAAENISSQMYLLNLIFGNHNITVVPSTAYGERIYYPTSTIQFINKNTSVSLIMQRKKYSLTLSILDELTGSVVTTPVDVITNVSSGVFTIINGTAKLELPAGPLALKIVTRDDAARIYQSSPDIEVDLLRDTALPITLNRTRYTVVLRIVDSITGRDAIGSFKLKIGDMDYGLVQSGTELAVPYGDFLLTIEPSKENSAVYRGITDAISVRKDMNYTIIVARNQYKVTLAIADSLVGPLAVPVNVFDNGTLIGIIDAGETQAQFQLVYGVHKIKIMPKPGYEYVYVPTELTVNVTKHLTVSATIQRQVYMINITIVDQLTKGKPIGAFMIYMNDTVVAKNVITNATIKLPYANYILKVEPLKNFEKIYEPSGEISIVLKNNMNVTVNVKRKSYVLTLKIINDMGAPLQNAEVLIYSSSRGMLVASMLSDSNGIVTLTLPYDIYNIHVTFGGYSDQDISVELDSTKDVSITMYPLPLTLVFRYLPIIVVMIVAGIAVYVALKIRARIAMRMSSAEELF